MQEDLGSTLHRISEAELHKMDFCVPVSTNLFLISIIRTFYLESERGSKDALQLLVNKDGRFTV